MLHSVAPTCGFSRMDLPRQLSCCILESVRLLRHVVFSHASLRAFGCSEILCFCALICRSSPHVTSLRSTSTCMCGIRLLRNAVFSRMDLRRQLSCCILESVRLLRNLVFLRMDLPRCISFFFLQRHANMKVLRSVAQKCCLSAWMCPGSSFVSFLRSMIMSMYCSRLLINAGFFAWICPC